MRSTFRIDTNLEYREFMATETASPSSRASETILGQVRKDLNPGAWSVFAKLSLVHLVTASATLLVCPQFGLRLAGEGMGVMKLFMVFGYYGCFVACGALFLGASLLVASWFLSLEELRAVRRNRWLHLSALMFLSLGSFVMFDADILFGLTLAWIAGSLLGGVAGLELGWAAVRPRRYPAV